MADEEIIVRLNIIIVLLSSLLFVLLFSALPLELFAVGIVLAVLVAPILFLNVLQPRP
ncbi:hypothetical protein [Natrinema salaciae]|uniref:Uncharacterized protein n=1 Tax=Natrinema salaciae TaxID=1186196 RepID=A0A1H9G0M8_9EURY|nr:hypothetical protein [Natrinema salaciae]SEQ43483.1 hypothetical protein SAMN04489841_1731 [Natrinema salaciae]